jgi:NADPH:quinone reductase-like Zn-dependent oxidoreductase
LTNSFIPDVAPRRQAHANSTMKALVFRGANDIAVESVPIPLASFGEAVIRVTLTTICGTDLHILKGEYPVRPGLVLGHEPVGIIHELGPGVIGYEVGERSLPVGNAHFVSARTGRNAAVQSAGGRLEILSTEHKLSTFSFRMLRQISQKSPTN